MFAVASQDDPHSYQTDDDWLAGVILLLIAGVCWLYASTLQSGIIRKYPEVDPSDHFLLNGIMLVPGVVLLSVLTFNTDTVFGLFVSKHSYEANRLFWTTMLVMAGTVTLVARAIWKQFVRRECDNLSHWQCSLKSAFGLLYVFLIERRWPDTLEALAMVSFALGMVMYCWQRSGGLCLKA